MHKRLVLGGACIVIFAALTLFSLIGLESVLDDVILDSIVMTPDNIPLWGQNPGDVGILTIRNFTFFNLTNPRGYIYRG